MSVFRRFLMAGAVVFALGSGPALAQKASPYESQLRGVQNSMNPSSPASVNQARERAQKIAAKIEADLKNTSDPAEREALQNAMNVANEILKTEVTSGAQDGSGQIAIGIDRYLSGDQQGDTKDGVPDFEKQIYAVYRGITWTDSRSLATARANLDSMKNQIDAYMANPDNLSAQEKSKIQRASVQVARLIPELDRRIAYYETLPEQSNQQPVQTASTSPKNSGGSIFDKAGSSGGSASFGEVDNAVLLGDERTLMLLKSKVGLANWREAAYIVVLDELLQESVNAIREELRKPDVPVERMTDLARALEAVQRLQAPLAAAKQELVKSGAKTPPDDIKDSARAHIEGVLDEIRKQFKREQQYAAANPTIANDASGGVTKPPKTETPPPGPGEPGYYMFIVEHYRHLYGLDGDSSMNGLNPDTQMNYLEKFANNIPKMIERFNQKLAEAQANKDRKLADELKAALQLLKQTQDEVNQRLAMK